MVNVLIKTDSHYKVNRKRIRGAIEQFLIGKKVKGKTEISISVVGDRQMRNLNMKFRKKNETTDVLSFPLIDNEYGSKFVDPPDDILHLGDIVISYPEVIEEASRENKMVDDKIEELVIHGVMHLLGYHHDQE
ncbi:rRNA maturation RNase YbeY [Candidatus Gottesmanbacteria bacterium RIFCSPHIGHO2_02_FULL_40_24]|uniref:Endoribonuclease YbeY n=1 Tax=Candidatus Gottesmanbacteria bacterium RIFCSPHIGHO2_01_FULL_40_15 TaxID=1798376 RepID=A0A1F5Z1I7_9BACT|nr:MAG: rRNA maturation RNase YbeY [Candidatus Gottesmanbacteria bacterium RIFCSPHIGHO2_01_FULL_40_15]OGG17479.1 MAG: rRNA maturation RNase YbeY [Candidatus Gottesmanbacteria bacterium RIFCSPHIGHO2_02_FULL_40_24]OGG21516.1 MAG: rRNA maturation RNase YbeY [Candidatus Gottesmanbacteria bacterium RIFCSPLOWO2_01_FULL_40_10]OGG25122.1 MAG: rRNA maturation RNase YbeY [Candidatus Gottesmanbacteria bacterium RIFCSPHIGHO2_12_FULL_40_13]OGG32757.1 MAG: rRNA maturation RNase YbeY [Candidatus Gottesmanbact